MPKRLVRHALVTYIVDGRQEMAFRGQTVELSDAEAKRFDALGATLPVDAELDRPGTLANLGEAPSDEELIAWVMSATPSEVAAVVATRPILAGRLEGALSQVEVSRDYQDQQLKMASRVASGAQVKSSKLHGESDMLDGEAGASHVVQAGDSDPAATPGGTSPASGDKDAPGDGQAPPVLEGAAPPTVPNSPEGLVISDPTQGTPDTTHEVETQVQAGLGGPAAPPAEGWRNPVAEEAAGNDAEKLGADTNDASPDFADTIVGGTVDDVTDYLADNPEHASAILEAENRRAAAANKDPRTGVVRAVEAAAGHTQ